MFCFEVISWQRGTGQIKKSFMATMFLSQRRTGMPCSCLPLMTKATVGQELCEGFYSCCQDLTFGRTKSPDHQTALLIQILFTPTKDTTITTFTATPQRTCRRNRLCKMYQFFYVALYTFVCLWGREGYMGRSLCQSCILPPSPFDTTLPPSSSFCSVTL